jgi:DNA-binding NarL/FixJ family response regulator
MENSAANDKPKIKVAVADDHSLFRKGLISLLSYFPTIRIDVEAVNGVDLFSKLKAQREYPDVLLLDVEMPEMDGIEVIRNINKKHFPINVIVLTTHNEETLIMEMVRLGARGFLLKNTDIHEVVKAIETVHGGGMYFNDNVSKTILQSVGKIYKPSNQFKKPSYFLHMNAREKDVLRMICAEKSTKEIADDLNISERTVEWHRSNLIERSGSKNIAGLVLYAVRHGLVE